MRIFCQTCQVSGENREMIEVTPGGSVLMCPDSHEAVRYAGQIYHQPVDYSKAEAGDIPGVACGHIALAMMVGKAIEEVRELKAFGKEPWVNVPMMKNAMKELEQPYRYRTGGAPFGIMMIQFKGPWDNTRDRYRYRHWACKYGDIMYDANGGVFPFKEWANQLMSAIAPEDSDGFEFQSAIVPV